jgi:hypothetical protein
MKQFEHVNSVKKYMQLTLKRLFSLALYMQ